MKKKSTIAIIGSGFAGVTTAKDLEKRLYKRIHKKHDIEILLIDKNPYQTIMTGLHEVATERVSPDALKLDLKSMFKKRSVVTVINDTVKSIDTKNYLIEGINGQYHYDFIVVSAGCRTAFFNIPGAEEHSFGLWSLEDAVKLNKHIRSCFEAASLESDLKKRSKLLSFYITGAGFTGCELAGDMAEWFPSLCREYNISRTEPTITIVDMLSRAASILPEKSSKKVEARFAKLGIKLELNASVTSVTDKEISFKKSGKLYSHATSTVIWTAGIEGCALMDNVSNISIGRGRRLVADSRLRTQGAYAAFVAGDNVLYSVDGVTVPQTVENAEQTGHISANNIASFIDYRSDLFKAYNPVFHGCMVTVGANYCAAKVSILGGRFSFSPPSFLAMFAKHGVNLIYIFNTSGFGRAITYIKDEFFRTKNGRNFLCFRNPLR